MTTPSPKVLILGPTAAERDTLSAQVGAEGYGVDVAGGSEEAIAKLRAGSFDLVMVDAAGSGAEGQRFLKALRGDAELALLPVVAVAAADDVEIISRWLALGADDHLSRGSSPEMLRARLRAALDRRRLREVESLTREMAVARSIQQDFLPESLPETRGVTLAAALHPAREVSGDFYDVFTLPPSGAIAMVVGDVCDKGVGAALFMALFRSLIRASADPVGGGAIQMIGGRRTLVRQSLEAATPADLLTRVAGFTNDYIARLHGRTNMFATVFLAILDPLYGRFDYLNAGHEPALVVAPDGSTLALRPTGPALGLLPEQVFTTGQGALERNHCLFAFTDGLVEARNPTGEAFGNERLHAALRTSGTSAPDVVRGVVEGVRAFIGTAEPHDDLTLLAATRTIG
ncbi:MAG TPA: SpoIIE family protein phosphatase [Gemmatimonadales bacterium]|nr:SpoIIE family protein phosphatase [Gemmatimonadales bacterium]